MAFAIDHRHHDFIIHLEKVLYAHSRLDPRTQTPTPRHGGCCAGAAEVVHLLEPIEPLLWSEPVARGWNVYLKNVRTGLPTSRKLCELGICTVALLTGATYEYHHHAPRSL
jgi:hypothetical protein